MLDTIPGTVNTTIKKKNIIKIYVLSSDIIYGKKRHGGGA